MDRYTGADVTVIPPGRPSKNTEGTEKELFGPGASQLKVKGMIWAKLKTKSNRETEENIYVVENLREPLLGRPAI